MYLFVYSIQVNNATGNQVMGTCRIFLAPKFDERGLPMLFRDQKHLMVELDKFTVTCKYYYHISIHNQTLSLCRQSTATTFHPGSPKYTYVF